MFEPVQNKSIGVSFEVPFVMGVETFEEGTQRWSKEGYDFVIQCAPQNIPARKLGIGLKVDILVA